MLINFARAIVFSCALLGFASKVLAQVPIPVRTIELRDAAPVTVKGRLKGPNQATRDFIVHVKQGATLKVSLQASKASSTHFNILPPDSQTALFVGEMQGVSKWQQKIDVTGHYTVRLYLNRAVARRGGTSDYTLKISVL